MKKSVLFIAFAAGLLLVSCGNDANDPDPQAFPKDAKLSITLQGTPVSRSADASLPVDDNAGEKTINRVAVGLFFSSGAVNVIKEFTAAELVSATTPTITCASSDNQKVVVVANAPTGFFDAASSYSNFITKTLSLSAATISTNLPMSGENSDVDIAAGATSVAASVTLSRLVARVSLSSAKTLFESTGLYPAAKFTITGVFMYNANSVSSVEPTLDLPLTLNTPLSGEVDNSWLSEAISGTVSNGETETSILPASTVYWFYTFCNSSTVPASQTRLVIKGDWDENGNGTVDAEDGTVYYPVVVNQLQPGTTITGPVDSRKGDGKVYRNCTYDVSVMIKGKGGNGPDANISPANLEVSITPASWSLNLSQSVTFE